MASLSKVPQYLRRYCIGEKQVSYTPREHATWRYILRQSSNFFSKHAVSTYLSGLQKTGITIEQIPCVEQIDHCLKEFGWGAVGVSGFVPPAAFLDLQSRSLMPIATDMRTLEHVAYTPAPDIVHEAAGHLPTLIEPAYRDYLSRYANMAKKAIISQEDILLYQAIRALSDIKENPDTLPSKIEEAQTHLNQTIAKMTGTSELAKVARMNWWTSEYGLVGDLNHPKIFGAGLLSSISESRHCLTPAVKKIRLSIKCTEQSYDITEPQPQLFVAESFEHLPEVLEELDQTLSYRIGGQVGLRRALESKTVNSIVFENHFSISGILETVLEETSGPTFIKLIGPCQIAYKGKELPGQGRIRHPEGFSSPLGRWKKTSDKSPSKFSDDELRKIGIVKGQHCHLEFTSGFTIQGEIINWIREENTLGIIEWKNCTVQRGSEVFYKPEWGPFDQIVGETARSVHGGPADRELFGDYNLGKISSSPGRLSPFTEKEKRIFEFYKQLQSERTLRQWDEKALADFYNKIDKEAPDEWLLTLEVLELVEHMDKAHSNTEHTKSQWKTQLKNRLLKRGIDLCESPPLSPMNSDYNKEFT